MPEEAIATGSGERSEVTDSEMPETPESTDLRAVFDLPEVEEDKDGDDKLLRLLERESKKEDEFTKTFQLIKSIGRGAFSKVALAQDGQGRQVAVKIVNLKAATLPLRQKLFEVRILRSCCHGNIIASLGSYLLPASHLALVTEYLDGGSLLEVVQVASVRSLLREDVIGAVCKAILGALVYLHDRDVVHRDIKPDNVLLSTSGDVKLCDFGFCVPQGRNPCAQKVGTPWYMAPEVARGHGLFTAKVDVWGMGILVVTMVTGEAPYNDFEPQKAMNFIATRGVPRIPEDKRVTMLVSSFVQTCCHMDPDLRPSSRDLLDLQLLAKVAPPEKVGHVVKYRQVIAPSVEDKDKWWEKGRGRLSPGGEEESRM